MAVQVSTERLAEMLAINKRERDKFQPGTFSYDLFGERISVLEELQSLRSVNAGVSGDWVLVPREPTLAMKQAANKRVSIVTPDGSWALALDEAARAYTAMLSAAPSATASEAFSAWLNQGPKLAAAAGCHVGIKVTEAKP